MKICHISTVHPQTDIRIFKKQCCTLVNAGHDVTLLTSAERNSVLNGVTISALKKRKSLVVRLFLNLPKVLIFTLKNQFDVYHAHDPELMPILFILHLLGRCVVYDMHENLPKQLETKKIPKPIKKAISFILPKLEKMILSRINVVYAELSYKKDYPFVKSYTDVLNMPLVNDLKALKLPKKSVFTFCYVGGVSKERCIDKILVALEQIQAEGIPIGFDCIGPVYCPETRNLIYEYEKKLKYFNYYGELAPNDAWCKVACCHVGLAILQPLPNYIESYPTKLFEYLALGIPVITSNFKLYKPIVEGNNVGVCIDPDDQISFEKAFKEIYFEQEVYRVMQANTKKIFKKKFSWDEELYKLDKFYSEIINNNPTKNIGARA